MVIPRVNIEVVGYSSDGDSRLLMAMRHQTYSRMRIENLFNASIDIAYIQDSVHIGTKLRNRLLKPSILLPMGCKQVSVSHLKLLISRAPKDIHGLVLKDICPQDRQNYGSLEKLMKPEVWDSLSGHVIDSQATVMYLKLCEHITSSLRDINLSPLERINKIWYALFFIRVWRVWIKKSSYSLTNNFITLNAYACVEINAHELVHVIRKFREDGDEHLFFPMLFESQPCEQTFRQLRSMTTLNWTKVNFTVLELTHMISRIDLQNEIIHFELKDTGIIFPRIDNRLSKILTFSLPSDDEIKYCVQSAKDRAINDAKAFGMLMNENEISFCDLPVVDVKNLNALIDEEDFDGNDTVGLQKTINVENECENLSNILADSLSIRDDSDEMSIIDENSRLTQITDNNGEVKTVQKSFVVWMLSDSKEKLSNDRLQRVQYKPNQKRITPRRALSVPNLFSAVDNHLICVSQEISLGQWCIFRKTSDKRYAININNCILGAVMCFQNKNGKNQNERQYLFDSASVNNNNVQVQATWYRINKNQELIPFKVDNSFFIDVSSYIVTLVSVPDFDDKKIFLSNSVALHLKNLLLKVNKYE